MSRICSLLVILTLVATARPVADQEPASPPVTAEMLDGLSWRSIGPAMFAGRVADVAGVPGNPDILYVAAASSGLFKSTNGGTTFESIFDAGNTLSIGAIAVEPGNPDVVYVGTGEGAVRNSISFGDGLYKTTDGGRTWHHLGLDDAERFSRIAIHPTNPRIVLAAAMGHAFGPNTERGLFRSTDGGSTWTRTLFINETTGASDVAIDPDNPDIVYAGMYDYLRQPWTFRSGGAGSGLFRSTDGGVTWEKLTDPALGNGLPGREVIGRVGVVVAPSDPNVVYALIEAAEDGVLWRSDDRGTTWRVVNDERRINNRPFYYTQVRVDPTDSERVYTLAGSFYVSDNGGQTFRNSTGRMFGDHHALWIDPARPTRLLCGTDGGFWISNDGGRTWEFLNRMPMAQAYHVGLDMAEPYNVLGGFQDHEIWRGPSSKWNRVGVRDGDWVRLRYMADGMYALADPRDPNLIYYNGHFGDITRLDMRNQEERYIQPYPPGPNGGGAGLEEYRFNWNSPIHMSPTNPDVLYYGGNVLFKTTDRGEHWTAISPDLTTNDKSKQGVSGGPISLDNTRAEYHCTIIAIAESPVDPDVVWAATDDGNLQVTRDGGEAWTNVAPNVPDAPAFGWFSSVSASRADAGTAYVSIDQHRLDDFAPYVYGTTDYGETWTAVGSGLRGYVHVVSEDPREPTLLYAGTELGIFASFDEGTSWVDLRLGLPPLAVVDLAVHPRDNDLVIGTHARGFYILDDATPLQRLARAVASDAPVTLFPPVPAVRYNPASDVSAIGNGFWVGRNRPYGAILTYYLPAAATSARLDIIEGRRLVASISGPARAGLNRAVWNLAELSACSDPVALGGRGGRGGRGRGGGGTWLRAIPGDYTVVLTVAGPAGMSAEQSFRIRPDPRVDATPDDLAVWHREAGIIEWTECTIRLEAAHVRSLDGQLMDFETGSAPEPLRAEARAVRRDLRPVVLGFVGDPRDPGHVNLSGRITWLTIQVGNNSGRPTPAQSEWIEAYRAQTTRYVGQLEGVVSGSLARLNDRLRAAGLAEIR